jgi:hypothetical protein
VRAKYLSKAVVGNVTHKLDDSHVWCDLLKVKHLYLKGRICEIQNGETVLFWLDSWKDGPLCARYPILFELCDEKEITVKKFIKLGCDLNFRRWLPAILHNQWECICNEILNTSLGERADIWEWKKGKMVNTL